MMQMYRVKFARRLPNDMVDLGDIVVCAGSNEAARDMVAVILELGLADTQFEVFRVKPSLYQVARREVRHAISTALATATEIEKASVATFPGVTEQMPDEYWHSVAASALVKAENENEAILKLARGIQREMSGEKQKSSTKELDIKCDRREYHPRTPAVEQNALFTFRRIFQGGDTRT